MINPIICPPETKCRDCDIAQCPKNIESTILTTSKMSIINADKVGEALKLIIERISAFEDEPLTEEIKWGCFYCKNYIREEGYNQQWGMYAFYRCYCSKGATEDYLINNSNKENCKLFEEGENQFVYISEKEKQEIQNSYYKYTK